MAVNLEFLLIGWAFRELLDSFGGGGEFGRHAEKSSQKYLSS